MHPSKTGIQASGPLWTAVVSCLLLCLAPALTWAQETNANTTATTNAPAVEEDAGPTNASPETAQPPHEDEAIHTDSSATTGQPAPTNSLAPAETPVTAATASPREQDPDTARSRDPRRSDRNRRGSPSSDRAGSSSSSDSGRDGSATGSASGAAKLDYAWFKIITDRNIFDPNRSPRRSSGPRERPKSVESFGLVGVMSYEKGTFAFFDGTSSSYKKVMKPNETIAGYKLTSIAPNSVKLLSGTNELELSIGSKLRREEEGEWTLSNVTETYTAASAAAANTPSKPSASDTTASGAESDIIKRLMQKREQE